MNFIVSLAHFIGWVVLIPILIYLVVSVPVSLFAVIFLYEKEELKCSRIYYFFRVGLNFWIWIIVFLANLIGLAYLRFLIKKGLSLDEISECYYFEGLTDYELKQWSKKPFSKCAYLPISQIF